MELNETEKAGKIEIAEENGAVVFGIYGELDHYGVRDIRDGIDDYLILHRPEHVILDLGKVTFGDSAGLGLILGRYSRIKEYGGELELMSVPHDFVKILRLAGTDKLIRINGGKTENERKRNG